MSQRFFRCPHCRLPHLEDELICPATGLAIVRRRPSSGPARAPSTAPPLDGPSAPGDLAGATLRASAWPAGLTTPSPAPGPGVAGASLPPLRSDELPSEHEVARRVPAARVPQLGGAGAAPGRGQGLAPGDVVGGVYVVKGVIGRGATAVVYEGEHQVLGRAVALKVMTDERVLSREARQRFLQEARAAASLSHAHICAIYDLGALPTGAMFCAMEFLRGEPVSTRLEREGALPLVEAVDVVGQLLLGLGAAHRKGIIHRDIKPENLFLAQLPGVARPVVKILDFGLVKHVGNVPFAGDDDEITRTGVVVGTPYYMAPEAVTGERDIDARVDLWAAGVVLFQLVTGRLPFRGAAWADTAQAILGATPAALASLRPSAPAGLQRIVDRALTKARRERYASTAEFLTDLARLRPELPR